MSSAAPTNNEATRTHNTSPQIRNAPDHLQVPVLERFRTTESRNATAAGPVRQSSLTNRILIRQQSLRRPPPPTLVRMGSIARMVSCHLTTALRHTNRSSILLTSHPSLTTQCPS
ncbi:hypothetical protein H4Q26_006941 [Puccinia striiformis f. sp. tritici PST-130]|nr:hypothetical protein H4Q26_006941 [Puccinia striiformis f. sp. tritici PST-130]